MPDFDLLAASLRADARDLSTFMEVLAAKLDAALPGSVEVHRAGGLFRKDHPVQELVLNLGEWRLRLAAKRGGVPEAERTHLVRGVALKTEIVELDAWVTSLAEALSSHAKSGETAADALRRFLE